MNKKLIGVIVLFLLIQVIFVFSSYTEASSEKVNLSVSSTIGNIEDKVAIKINLNNTSSFVSGNLVLNYDTECLEYVSYTEGEVLKKCAMSIVKNNSDTGKIAIGFVSNPSATDETVKAGNILTIVFKVKANLEKETKLSLECTSLKDKEGREITTIITNGKIQKFTNNNEILQDNNGKLETKFPEAGLKGKTVFITIFIFLISITVILYKKINT